MLDCNAAIIICRNGAQKLLGVLITIGEAVAYVVFGMYGDVRELGAGNAILIILQVLHNAACLSLTPFLSAAEKFCTSQITVQALQDSQLPTVYIADHMPKHLDVHHDYVPFLWLPLPLHQEVLFSSWEQLSLAGKSLVRLVYVHGHQPVHRCKET